ncbi:MAG TPA: hypothetical protein PKA42_00625 [Candidatus Paceibacterota bacterium]|nr:hypothetical protein [Candidatus Paceibacterota bacterium]HMO82648.1 hypothetical protein [Candidatus Paceibacterota bacterium]
MEQQPNSARRNEHIPGIEVTNTMQMELIKKSGLDPMEWINTYGEGFRELITGDPSLVGNYEQNMPDTLAAIEKRLRNTLH